MKRIWTLAPVGLIALTLGCVDREAQDQAKRTKEIVESAVVPVRVMPATTRSISNELEITGQVATTSDVTIGARQAGRVVSVRVREGDSVAAGQVIAEQESTVLQAAVQQAQSQLNAARSQYSQARSNAVIGPQKSLTAIRSAEAQLRSAKAQLDKAKAGARDEEIKQAEAQVDAAKFSLETAKKEMERQKALFEGGAVSRQRLEQAENGYRASLSQYEQALEALRMRRSWTRPEDIRSAEEQVRQAEEALRTAEANKRLDVLLTQQVEAAQANVRAAEATLDIARKNLADTVIRSPFSGRISGNPVQPGTFLAPGTPVARLIGAEGIFFEGEVPESSIVQVSPGKPVRVSIDAIPNRTWAGTVAAVSPSGSEVGRLFKVRIQLSGSTEEIKPGMFARGTVTVSTVADATVIPASAVLRVEDKHYVFVVEGDTARRIQVQPGVRTNGSIEVRNLPGGAVVVVDGQSQLTDGAKVKIEEEAAPTRPGGAGASGA